MSVLPTVSLSAVIARLRQRLDHHLLPSKRKLDDYGLESDSNSDSGDPSRHLVSMLTPDPFSPSSSAAPFPPLADAASRVFPSSSSSPSPSSTLHFFVRTMSKTRVIHASPFDTVDSVIDQIRTITGITTWEQRLIYAGRQLPGDCTLAECSLENDCCLHLTGRLRSTRFPRTWQVVNDLVSSVSALIESGCYADRLRAMRENSNIDELVKEFLIILAKTASESDEVTWGHLRVFLVAGAPMVLIKLYLSAVREDRTLAERAIQLFLRPNSELLPKSVQVRCAPIMLEFCKLLAGTVGKKDQLYLSCRSAYAMLLEALDWRRVSQLKSVASVIVELFPFVSEMAGTLMEGLSSESMMVSTADLNEFAKFSCALRGAIQDWMGENCPIPELLYNGTQPQREDWIGSLHDIYADLLKKVDQCLKKVEGFLEKKGSVQSEIRWAGWSHILAILTELNCFSNIYEGAGQLLHSVLLARRCPLNALIRRAKRSENLRWLLKHKDVTDFEARQNLVLMMFPDGKDDYDELHEMLIDRSQLLAESFEYIGQADATALHGRLFMEFKNEVATGPGVLREWFCLVCQAIFSPQNVLFLSCANDRRRVFPNPASAVDPLHLKYFGFCGRVIALALMHRVQVGVVFDRVFFLQLAGKGLTLEDIQNADPCLYMSCKKILEMDAELLDSDVLGLTFFREYEELGTHRVVELCPGGKEIAVNSQNKEEYINLLIEHCFVTSISEQISHFAQGFSDILANSNEQKFIFQSLDLEDFDRMLGGSDSVINVREWKAHTEYNGYKARDRQICWFWKIVEGMPAEQQRVLLFFWTSVKYLPVDGFGGLGSKLYIYKASESQDRLPASHTCFYRLCLPVYNSISIMRSRLHMITQEHISCTFGIW
ncbi:E3 ubiquitin-protein ligase UPL5 [Elaeis guineensis]|uniref:HECT-type E3 ubiquitin transferase n=1 Tax=Elaeis guineensis var. tenera TaxID=51953 RepID=A0A6I9QTQ0_ELAGV|nr:LOW QUALITY PROTEIN: E3 ubiquitin-protein ligase UPL5 [Elaeis guineensis]